MDVRPDARGRTAYGLHEVGPHVHRVSVGGLTIPLRRPPFFFSGLLRIALLSDSGTEVAGYEHLPA